MIAALAGCGDIDGEDDPFAGMVNHCASNYHVPALVPPWVLVPLTNTPTTLMMVLPLSLSTAVSFSPSDLTSATAALGAVMNQSRDFLQVELLPGPPTAGLATLSSSQAPVAQARAIRPIAGTSVGAGSVELCWRDSVSALPLPQRRDAFLEYPSSSLLAGKTVHLTFRTRDSSSAPGNNPLCDDPMISAMILGTAPGGTGQQVCR